MADVGSILLFFAWCSGLVVALLTAASFEQRVDPAGPRRRLPIALAGAALGSLWLPWVTGTDGQRTLSGWFALDAATVVMVVVLVGGIVALAALPDRGGEHRDLLSMLLALSMLGVFAGNVAIGASGGWGNQLTWGAAVGLVATAALAVVEHAHHRSGPTVVPEDSVDVTGELRRVSNPYGL